MGPIKAERWRWGGQSGGVDRAVQSDTSEFGQCGLYALGRGAAVIGGWVSILDNCGWGRAAHKKRVVK